MSKALDFNSLVQPTMDITLKDDAHTTLHVTAPLEKLIVRFQAGMNELSEVVKSGNAESIDTLYTLAAELLSFNRDFVTITGAELRSTYRIDLTDLIVLFNVYMDFVHEIASAKN